MVRYIEDMAQWNELMETSKTKTVVVDFTASW
jgi:thiol:disulfide interchange protein